MEYCTRLTEYKIIVCKKCRQGVLPNHVDSHLGGLQHRLPLTRRRQIQEEISTWSNLFQTEADLTRLKIPVHPLPRRCEELDWYDDGRRCHLCRHIVRTDERIKKHYRTEHGWENEWKRGRKTADRQRA